MLDVAAQELDNLVSDAQKNQYLIFALGPNHYGIDIKNVTEIIGIQKITKVPELPEYVQGIISLRGKIIPVVDVRMRFKIEAVEYNDRTCIIIVDLGNVSSPHRRRGPTCFLEDSRDRGYSDRGIRTNSQRRGLRSDEVKLPSLRKRV